VVGEGPVRPNTHTIITITNKDTDEINTYTDSETR
jgi:hypothetical protein